MSVVSKCDPGLAASTVPKKVLEIQRQMNSMSGKVGKRLLQQLLPLLMPGNVPSSWRAGTDQYLLSTCQVLGLVLNTSSRHVSLADEETEGQSSSMTCPRLLISISLWYNWLHYMSLGAIPRTNPRLSENYCKVVPLICRGYVPRPSVDA